MLNLHLVYQITVNGMAPLGLTNTSGVLLDGRGMASPAPTSWRSCLHRVYQITVNGMAPLGLTNTSGVLLDGRGNGQPGTNFVAILRRFGLDKRGVPFNKLIRDQLGGKPLSSRWMKG